MMNVKVVKDNMKKNKYFEIEYKFDAKTVTFKKFTNFINNLTKKSTLLNILKINGTDDYFGLKNTVVRYRHDKHKYHELTVKKRTSSKSTMIRHEIDMKLPENTDPKDVYQFYTISGYKKLFTLYKKADIYTLSNHLGIAILVIYDVYKKGNKKNTFRFIEVEGHKNQSLAQNTKIINYWKKLIFDELKLNESKMMNKTLFEVFSHEK